MVAQFQLEDGRGHTGFLEAPKAEAYDSEPGGNSIYETGSGGNGPGGSGLGEEYSAVSSN
jgi:hypothetical protein